MVSVSKHDRNWHLGSLGFALLSVLILSGVTSVTLGAAADAVTKEYTRTAKEMDWAYMQAGTRVDIARLDLEELQRQGKPVPQEVYQSTCRTDQEMRQRWLVLENQRKSINARMRVASGKSSSSYVLKVENLCDSAAGEAEWFGLRWAKLISPSGKTLLLHSSQFKGGCYKTGYAYQCQQADTAFVYGKQTSDHTMEAWFDFDVPEKQDVALVISGLDHDKPGKTKIRVSLNGQTISEGENDFKKNGWSEKQYLIPNAAFSRKVKAISLQDVQDAMKVWQKDIAVFAQWSQQQAQQVEQKTASYRKGLVWKKRTFARDWWKTGYLRGLAYETDSAYPWPKGGARPWFAGNREYEAKAFADAEVNFIYMYPLDDYDNIGVKNYSEFAEYNDPIGTPVGKVYWPLSFPHSKFKPKDPVKAAEYYLDPQAGARELIDYAQRLVKAGNDPNTLRAMIADEPRIDDVNTTYHKSPAILELYRKYLAGRQAAFKEAGVSLKPGTPPVLSINNSADRVAWMEWQYFKLELVTDFYAKVSELLSKENLVMLTVIQDYLHHDPQTTGYPAYGKLPIIATDLYNGGAIIEAFSMDLLKSTAKGKAILVPGTGYSCRTPEGYHRSMASGIVRADGIIQWINTYASKYRYPYYFAQPDMKDDRGRQLLDSWRPEYWSIQRDVYRRIAKAETYLVDTKSAAQVGVLYSMRSVIAESANGGYWSNTTTRNCRAVYDALVDLNRPFEACMVEGLDDEKLSRYKVLFLVDAKALSLDECRKLGDWVKRGGTLISTGAATYLNPWGQRQRDYSLADLFGVQFERFENGQREFAASVKPGKEVNVLYDTKLKYARVKPKRAKVLGRWGNNAPAITLNRYGRGKVYFLSLVRTAIHQGSDPSLSMRTETHPGLFDLIRTLASENDGQIPFELVNGPKYVDMQIRKKGDAWIVHFLDWKNGRTLDDLNLKVNAKGTWKVSYPMDGVAGPTVRAGETFKINPVKIHNMLVFLPL